MRDPDFDGRLAHLLENLDEVVDLFRVHGETRWLAWATTCRSQLATYDAAAFDHVLGAFGGMGSLNDLLILGYNGHTVGPDEEATVNRRLSDLRTSIWEDATALTQDLRRST